MNTDFRLLVPLSIGKGATKMSSPQGEHAKKPRRGCKGGYF